jgi:hypothetical protein
MHADVKKRLMVGVEILVCVALIVLMFLILTTGLNASSIGGSGKSVRCAGFTPYPCARQDTSVFSNAAAIFNIGTAPPLTVDIDPLTGERLERVTNGSTTADCAGCSWQSPQAGYLKVFNCAGAITSAACASATTHQFFADRDGDGWTVWQFTASSMALSRVDSSTLTGNEFLGNSLGNWSSLYPNILYTNRNIQETTSVPMNYVYYTTNPASPGTPSGPTTVINLNTGPNGNAWDQQTGSGGLISFLNGLLSIKGWPAAGPPIVCDGTTCVQGITGGQDYTTCQAAKTTLTGGTCATVSGGASGNGCVDVSATGGSLSGYVYFAFTQDDGGTPPTEQNISWYAANLGGTAPFTSYNFAGGTGKITGLTAPTKITSPVTAAHWNLYCNALAVFAGGCGTKAMALGQAQIASSITSCSGAGGGGCPAMPITSVATTVSATNHMNRSCELDASSGSKCAMEMVNVSNDDTTFGFNVGGIGQGLETIQAVWNTTCAGQTSCTETGHGGRWLDLTTGVISNGATDAAGNACPSANCWTSTGIGPMTYHPDPNSSDTGSTYQGLLMHEGDQLAGGDWEFLSLSVGAYAGSGPLWWNVATGDVYHCASETTACDAAGHPVSGYDWWTQVGGSFLDGSFDHRAKTVSAANCTTATSINNAPCVQTLNNSPNQGPCSISGPCGFPAPNLSTTGVSIGSGRVDSHGSAVDDNPTHNFVYDFLAYFQGTINNALATGAGAGASRTGCPSACVDTFTISSGFTEILPGDVVEVTGVDDSSFNVICTISYPLPTWEGTQFSCPDPITGHSNATSEKGNAYKIDTREARAWEQEVVGTNPYTNITYRFISNNGSNLFAGPINTGPNGSISPDGHYALWTTIDTSSAGAGGAISTATLGSVSGSGGSGYSVNDTGTINNPATGATLASYTVNTVSSGAVATFTVSTAGAVYQPMNNVPTTIGGSQPGSGTGFVVNITAVSGGRTDEALGELR